MSEQKFTKADLERVQNTFQTIINKYRIALADSINCPKGVIPDSAKNLISDADLQMAVTRRELFNQGKNEKHPDFIANCLICGKEILEGQGRVARANGEKWEHTHLGCDSPFKQTKSVETRQTF